MIGPRPYREKEKVMKKAALKVMGIVMLASALSFGAGCIIDTDDDDFCSDCYIECDHCSSCGSGCYNRCDDSCH